MEKRWQAEDHDWLRNAPGEHDLTLRVTGAAEIDAFWLRGGAGEA